MNRDKEIFDTFVDTVKTRRGMAKGARHRKGSRGSRKVTLGHEYLSKGELEAMNGEVRTLYLNKRYTAEEFLDLPPALRVKYVIHLCEKYSASFSKLSVRFFGRNRTFVHDAIEHTEAYKNDARLQDIKNRNRMSKHLEADLEGLERDYGALFTDTEGKALLNDFVLDLNKRYSAEEWKAMSADDMGAYVIHICNEFKVGISTVSKHVFGRSSNFVQYQLQSRGIMDRPEIRYICENAKKWHNNRLSRIDELDKFGKANEESAMPDIDSEETAKTETGRNVTQMKSVKDITLLRTPPEVHKNVFECVNKIISDNQELNLGVDISLHIFADGSVYLSVGISE